jgi:hypothetical protein
VWGHCHQSFLSSILKRPSDHREVGSPLGTLQATSDGFKTAATAQAAVPVKNSGPLVEIEVADGDRQALIIKMSVLIPSSRGESSTLDP